MENYNKQRAIHHGLPGKGKNFEDFWNKVLTVPNERRDNLIKENKKLEGQRNERDERNEKTKIHAVYKIRDGQDTKVNYKTKQKFSFNRMWKEIPPFNLPIRFHDPTPLKPGEEREFIFDPKELPSTYWEPLCMIHGCNKKPKKENNWDGKHNDEYFVCKSHNRLYTVEEMTLIYNTYLRNQNSILREWLKKQIPDKVVTTSCIPYCRNRDKKFISVFIELISWEELQYDDADYWVDAEDEDSEEEAKRVEEEMKEDEDDSE